METLPGKFYGEIPIPSFCSSCTLDSECIVVEPVCCSVRQMWSIFFCLRCDVRGLINVSTYFPQLEIYKWKDDSPVVRNWIRIWRGWDS